jgi:hypothetical protein
LWQCSLNAHRLIIRNLAVKSSDMGRARMDLGLWNVRQAGYNDKEDQVVLKGVAGELEGGKPSCWQGNKIGAERAGRVTAVLVLPRCARLGLGFLV